MSSEKEKLPSIEDIARMCDRVEKKVGVRPEVQWTPMVPFWNGPDGSERCQDCGAEENTCCFELPVETVDDPETTENWLCVDCMHEELIKVFNDQMGYGRSLNLGKLEKY